MATIHERKTATGTTKVRETKNGDVYIDSYFGDIKDKNDHDRYTLKISSGDGKLSGHGFNHEPWEKKG